MATTAAKLGVGSVIKVDEAGGSTYNAVKNEMTATLTIELATSDTTSKDSSQWAEAIPSIRSWTVTFEGYLDHTSGGDTNGFEVINTAIMGAATMEIQVSVDETGGPITFTGTCIPGSLVRTLPHGETVTWSCTCQGTGPLTEA